MARAKLLQLNTQKDLQCCYWYTAIETKNVHMTFMQSALSFLYGGPSLSHTYICNTCSTCTPVHVHAQYILTVQRASSKSILGPQYMGIGLNSLYYGVLYLGSHYNTGPYINFPHFGNSNLGKLPYTIYHIPYTHMDALGVRTNCICFS